MLLKNKVTYNGKLLKMDDNIYSLRRQVLSVIYEAKQKGYVLPRVEVRIISPDSEVCAYAYMGKNIVHVNLSYFSKRYNKGLFTQIILHELVHAIFNIGEVPNCKLMHCSKFWENKVDLNTAWTLFEKYYRNWSK